MNLIRDLQIIYEKLHYGQGGSINTQLETKEAIQYLLSIAEQRDYSASLYKDLTRKIALLRKDTIPTLFVERYCVDCIGRIILNKFDCNIAEAYALAYVALNNLIPRISLHHKLNTSGLVKPAKIDGKQYLDPEAITTILIGRLTKRNLLKILDNNAIVAGTEFKIDLKNDRS